MYSVGDIQESLTFFKKDRRDLHSLISNMVTIFARAGATGGATQNIQAAGMSGMVHETNIRTYRGATIYDNSWANGIAYKGIYYGFASTAAIIADVSYNSHNTNFENHRELSLDQFIYVCIELGSAEMFSEFFQSFKPRKLGLNHHNYITIRFTETEVSLNKKTLKYCDEKFKGCKVIDIPIDMTRESVSYFRRIMETGAIDTQSHNTSGILFPTIKALTYLGIKIHQ